MTPPFQWQNTPQMENLLNTLNGHTREQEEFRAGIDEVNRSIDEHNAEQAREQQETKLREDRLAAIAEAAHLREEDAEKRNRLLLVVAILSLIAAVIAAVAAIIAI